MKDNLPEKSRPDRDEVDQNDQTLDLTASQQDNPGNDAADTEESSVVEFDIGIRYKKKTNEKAKKGTSEITLSPVREGIRVILAELFKRWWN